MKTVLLVEDEPFLREVLQWELEEAGARVETAGNGGEAIAAIERGAPDLLLLDLLMPRMDGFAVLDWLRGAGRRIPTVVLSNLSDPISRQRCIEAGAVDFVVKSSLEEGDVGKLFLKYLAR